MENYEKALEYLEKYKERDMLMNYMHIAFNSGKWKKWRIENSPTTYEDHVEMCGHYVRGTAEINNIIVKFENKYRIDLNAIIRYNIKQAMEKYYYFFEGENNVTIQ